MKILIIEDEKDISSSIVQYLKSENYACEVAGTYSKAMEKILSYSYDCIILDLMLPGGDGLKILEEIKYQHKEDGVIIISAKGSVEEKIKGLQLGADDYLAKPFHLSELVARVFSIIRRKQFDNTNILIFNELQIDILARQVIINEQSVLLTKKEFDLLLFLAGSRNKIVSKAAVAEHLLGEIADTIPSYDIVYTHLKNLKKKLNEAGGRDYIKTVYGVGYKWQSE